MPHRIICSWYTLAVDGWAATFGTARRGLGGAAAHPSPSSHVDGWAPWDATPPSLLHAVPNVTAHPSTASVPITVLFYSGPLLRTFNVPIKWLMAV